MIKAKSIGEDENDLGWTSVKFDWWDFALEADSDTVAKWCRVNVSGQWYQAQAKMNWFFENHDDAMLCYINFK